jgi:hypothetical protein
MMTTIQSTIRREMALMVSIFLLAFVIAPAAIILNFGANWTVGFTTIMCEVVAIPLFTAWGVRIGKLRKTQRDQRMETYRASPESHLLNLGGAK